MSNDGYGFQAPEVIKTASLVTSVGSQWAAPLKIEAACAAELTEREANARVAERIGREGMEGRAKYIRENIQEYSRGLRGGCSYGTSHDGKHIFIQLPGRTDALEILEALMLGLIT